MNPSDDSMRVCVCVCILSTYYPHMELFYILCFLFEKKKVCKNKSAHAYK